MKNKFLKGAHISERKVRELLKLFAEDLTATQIANISGISRITVNAYLKLIRTHIAKYCEEKNPVHYNNGTFAFLPLQISGTNSQQKNGSVIKKSFYGIFKQDDIIYTDKLNIDSSWLYDWLKGKIEADQVLIEKYRLDLYNGIVDFNTLKLFRINNAYSGFTKGRSQIDEIDLFWGMLKSRLVKFRGLNGSTLYLHVKETEFRYNYRNEDLFELLVNIIHKRPLHLSKHSKA
jgi:transposase